MTGPNRDRPTLYQEKTTDRSDKLPTSLMGNSWQMGYQKGLPTEEFSQLSCKQVKINIHSPACGECYKYVIINRLVNQVY